MPLRNFDQSHPGYVAGLAYSTLVARATAAAVAAVDTIYVYPFRVFFPIVVKNLYTRTTVLGAASSIKMAIWADHPTLHRPNGAPIVGDDTGQTTQTNNSTQTFDCTDTVFAPGWYWAGSKLTGTLPTMYVIDPSMTFLGYFMGQTSNLTSRALLSIAHAYATALPTFNGADAWTESAANCPVIGLGL